MEEVSFWQMSSRSLSRRKWSTDRLRERRLNSQKNNTTATAPITTSQSNALSCISPFSSARKRLSNSLSCRVSSSMSK